MPERLSWVAGLARDPTDRIVGVVRRAGRIHHMGDVADAVLCPCYLPPNKTESVFALYASALRCEKISMISDYSTIVASITQERR